MMNKKLLFGILAVILVFIIGWFLFPRTSYKEESASFPVIKEYSGKYPETVGQTYFDVSKEANNTVALLIKTFEPLTEEQIVILRNSGVRKLSASEIETVYHSLIEENRVEEVRNLDFVEDVYSYKVK